MKGKQLDAAREALRATMNDRKATVGDRSGWMHTHGLTVLAALDEMALVTPAEWARIKRRLREARP